MSPQYLLALERNTERGVAGALRSLTTCLVFERMETEEFPPVVARLVVESGVFVRASGQMAFSRQRVPFYNHFRGAVSVEINTPRTGGVAYHHAHVGLVRRYFSDASGGPRLSPYSVLHVEESAGSLVFVKEGERDVTTLTFTLQLAIPNDLLDTTETQALPTAPAAPV